MSFRRGLQLAGFARRHLGRMGEGRRAVMGHLADPRAENLPMPTFVQLRVTNLCNLRCKMCGQWGDTGIYRSQSGADATDGALERERIQELIGAKRQLALSDYVRLLDELVPARPIISLFGGEPFLYPDIIPLIREIKARGLTCTVITNGGRLEALARELVEIGIDSIAISIDGPPDVHNRIRGRADSFEKAAAGIRAVSRWQKELKRALPMQIAILPVTELNMDAIAPAVEALRRLPLDTINVGLRWFVPESAGADYERVMREQFGIAATSWKGFEFDWKSVGATRAQQTTELVKLLKGLRRRRFLDSTFGRPWTSFVPDVPAQKVPEYFSDFGQTFGHNLCPVAWYFAQVEPDGEVTFCGDFPDYFIGNVRRQSFREIWTGEKAQKFRAKLAKEPLPICARCCGSYVYGKWERPGAPASRS
jgi:radical SAM protein with 4Fe4S-binding SPASM domain